jgi:hypothetical protein
MAAPFPPASRCFILADAANRAASLILFVEYFASPKIDQMHALTGCALHRLEMVE